MNKIKHLYHSRSFIIRETTTGAKNKLKKTCVLKTLLLKLSLFGLFSNFVD